MRKTQLLKSPGMLDVSIPGLFLCLRKTFFCSYMKNHQFSSGS